MASAKTEAKKRHNPVESICRKLRAIQKREVISNPVHQIIRYHQSSSCDSPQTKTKTTFGEVLRRMSRTHLPRLETHSGEKADVPLTSPGTVSPGTLASHPSASGCHTLCCSASSVYYVALIGLERSMKTSSPPNEKLTIMAQKGSFVSSDTEDGGPEDVASSACEEELLSGIFHACDTKHRGTVRVGKIIDFLSQTASQDLGDSALEELWTVLDPGKTDVHMDLSTFQAIMKEWMTCCRNREETRSQSDDSTEDAVFELQDGVTVVMSTDITDTPLGFEAWYGVVSEGVLAMSDLITYMADLHLNKQRLEEENSKCKLALDALEEANRQLAEDCAELRLQIKSARQVIWRTSVLEEELEELKARVNASEEQKTLTMAQNKQFETENRALILQIRILQEENIKNAMDIDLLEKKIEELSETEKEHQMQLHTYENMLLRKDAAMEKKNLSIEELKSTIIEYRSVIEDLRGDKDKLAHELQHFQHELIVNGIQLNDSGHSKNIVSEEVKSLHDELALAQTAEYEEVSEIGTLIDRSLQWVTSPEAAGEENCVTQLTNLSTKCQITEALKKFKLDLHFREESLSRQKQLELFKQLQDDAVNQEGGLRKRRQEAGGCRARGGAALTKVCSEALKM
ncbi:lymphoid-restricted membrane protein [Nannospalax galili]|uniref:lymphoid-restricted membrane protein n=1 Tax=Nannospalax galili TaxID=1026970 RepID=UPI00111BF70E|nr:lymphoid-restricted membrane protein [Nannospalax galili]